MKATPEMEAARQRRDKKRAERRLRMAAQDLLDACKLMCSCCAPGSLSFETAREAARAAIAKVEGKA